MRTKSIILLLILLWGATGFADELVVAAAADLRYAMTDIAARFEKETGHKVNVSFGSSGNFFNLIQNGGPYDVYFSADVEYPQKLEVAGLTVPGSLYEYATGKLVLWVPQGSPLDLNRGMEVLLDGRVRKIAIANPQHAPYGRAAVAAMQNAKGYDRVQEKLVRGDNISQTAQFVETGNADIGFIALSLAVSPSMKSKGRYVEVPTASYPAIRQALVVVKSSKKQELAKQFVEYFKNAQSAETLKGYGFTVPTGAKK